MNIRPAEWCKGKTIWLAWPYDHELWGNDLMAAQNEFLALIHALKNENITVVFPDKKQQELAQLSPMMATHIIPYGDIWLRDTFPIMVKDEKDRFAAVIPQFNGWGKKYLLPHDSSLAEKIADELGLPKIHSPLVFEGGALECNGQGVLLTTEQCLLNPNRNPTWSKSAIEQEFLRLFGVKKIIWLKRGLLNDHTDGHIDTIARFLSPQQIAIMTPSQRDDPNYEILEEIKEKLSKETDAQGKPFELINIPSPGAIYNRDGVLMPASYLNFIMADATVAVPLYGAADDDEAVKCYKAVCSHKVIGLSAKAILTGGGAFHCLSQEIYR